jgi:hypothetical protein
VKLKQSCNEVTRSMTLLSLRATLLYRLHQALLGDCEEEWASFTQFLQVNGPRCDLLGCYEPACSLLTSPIWRKISLQKKPNKEAVLYLSAIPQQRLSRSDSTLSLALFKSMPEPFAEISQQMVSRLEKKRFQSINSERDHKGSDRTLRFQLWAEFQIETHRPGWISFQLSDRGIGLWLDQLQQLIDDDNSKCFEECSEECSEALSTEALSTEALLTEALLTEALSTEACSAIAAFSTPPSDTEKMLWQVQYTHARCCTLLRLWQQVQPDLAASAPDSAAFSAAFGLTHLLRPPPSVTLIHTLIETVDDLFWIPYRWPAQQYFLLLKRASQLCQAFEAFSSVRLSGFGRLSQSFTPASNPELIREFQAGFYLAIATKNILKVLLHRYLSAEAPTEL